MKLKYFTLTLVALSVLSACNIGDDNDAEVSALQAQVEQLQSELDNIDTSNGAEAVSYTHLRAHETPEHLVCRLLLDIPYHYALVLYLTPVSYTHLTLPTICSV